LACGHFNLEAGSKGLTIEGMIAFAEKLFGRKLTPEEIADARREIPIQPIVPSRR
jgi:hypothetical protein